MIHLVRSEWTKLFTTRVWIGLILGACLLVGASAALITGFAGSSQNGQQGIPAIGTPAFERAAFSVGTNGTILMLILGIIGMTQEYRHRTATPTFLTTPHRWRVVVAKLLGYLLAAIPFAALILGVGLLVVEIYASARGAGPSFTGTNLRVLAGAGAALVLYAVIGVGVGALLRNQVGAIVGSLVYLFVVENVIAGIPATATAYKWLPGGALRAIVASGQPGPDILQPWQGGLLLLGYGLVAAVLGTLITVRRDIT
jgi:ABC-2 type transport system permease protein